LARARQAALAGVGLYPIQRTPKEIAGEYGVILSFDSGKPEKAGIKPQ
jgi:hypothetical protein